MCVCVFLGGGNTCRTSEISDTNIHTVGKTETKTVNMSEDSPFVNGPNGSQHMVA